MGVLEHFFYGRMPFVTPNLLFSGLGTGSRAQWCAGLYTTEAEVLFVKLKVTDPYTHMSHLL